MEPEVIKTKEERDQHGKKTVPERVPTLVELKRIIPKHCFEGDLMTSMYYVFKDFALVAFLYFSVLYLDKQLLAMESVTTATVLRYILWPTYWFLQGVMLGAVFTVAHDCGHGSFSKYTVINDIIGNIMHSVILVPYYPWKLTHRHHHKFTANIDKDEVFYPLRQKGEVITEDEKAKPPLPYFGFGLGWFIYLALGSGTKPRNHKHFNPFDDLFEGHVIDCIISVICWCAWTFIALPAYISAYGWGAFIAHYLIPIFLYATFLIIVTFLHHHDEDVPWYADHNWDFVRGQLSSVDRHYGWFHNIIHNIGTHQIHHLFTIVPHYRLEEATAIFRKAYPELVRINNENPAVKFIKMYHLFEDQRIIPKDAEYHAYSHKIKTQ